MNEHIQYLADHAAFLCSLSRLSNQTDEMKKLMKSSAEAALKAAGTILSMMEMKKGSPATSNPRSRRHNGNRLVQHCRRHLETISHSSRLLLDGAP